MIFHICLKKWLKKGKTLECHSNHVPGKDSYGAKLPESGKAVQVAHAPAGWGYGNDITKCKAKIVTAFISGSNH